MTKVVVLELNELNFDALEVYIGRGELPHFRAFFDEHGYSETTAEVRYAELEPWIQWVTAHTGKSFAQHGIFRLGDIVGAGVPQIWETLEGELGLKVGAISPMNAANRLTNAAYFIPDPWTPSTVSGSPLVAKLGLALSQAVNDNASGKLTISTIVALLGGLMAYARLRNYSEYIGLAAGTLKKPWNRALFLDLFLADLLITLTKRTQPQFTTLFLNGGAHLQHHYMFNSPAYTGENRNPDWYLGPSADPVGDIYRLYDRILGQVRASLPDYRIILMTGLHQDPYPKPIYYWRFLEHARLLKDLAIDCSNVAPRMSRDFLISFADRNSLENAFKALGEARIDGERAFNVEARSDDIFVEFVYDRAITPQSKLVCNGVEISDLSHRVAFVALKNGHHNGIGYFADSGLPRGAWPARIPLSGIYAEICSIFGLKQAPLAPEHKTLEVA